MYLKGGIAIVTSVLLIDYRTLLIVLAFGKRASLEGDEGREDK